MDSSVANSNRRPLARNIATLAISIATVLGAGGCSAVAGLGQSSFAVGDCVTIETRVTDHDLKDADCGDAVGTFDAAVRIYKVDAVLDGSDQSCDTPQGFFGVEFSHEPHDKTYCLSMAT